MKARLGSVLMLAFAAAPTTWIVAGNDPSSPLPAVQDDHDHEHEEEALEEVMHTFKEQQRALKGLVEDLAANEAALLESLRAMEHGALVALGEEPHLPEGVAGKDAELFLVGFKHQMSELLTTVLGMQEATLKGDADALRSGYEALGGLKEEGHDRYKVE